MINTKVLDSYDIISKLKKKKKKTAVPVEDIKVNNIYKI